MCTVDQFPISINQQGWFFTSPPLDNREISFNDAICFRFIDKPDLFSLQRAIDELLIRHETLRTTFRLNSSKTPYPSMTSLHHSPYLQRVSPTGSLKLSRTNIHTSGNAREKAASIATTVTQMIVQPFRYDVCPMMRATLLSIDDAETILVIVVSHLLTDRITVSLICKEINDLYSSYRIDLTPAMPQRALRYGIFAQQQRDDCLNGRLARGVAYWMKEWEAYESAFPSLQDLRHGLGDELASQNRSSVVGAHELSEEIFGRMRTFAHTNNLTVYMLVVGAWFLLLYKYTGRTSIAIWSYVANRSQSGTAKMFGWLANTVLLGTNVDGQMFTENLLANVRGAIFKAVQYQQVPAGFVWISFLEKHLRPPHVFDNVYISIDGTFSKHNRVNENDALELMNIGAAVRPGIEISVIDEYNKGRLGLATSVLAPDETTELLNNLAQALEWLISYPSARISAFVCP